MIIAMKINFLCITRFFFVYTWLTSGVNTRGPSPQVECEKEKGSRITGVSLAGSPVRTGETRGPPGYLLHHIDNRLPEGIEL